MEGQPKPGEDSLHIAIPPEESWSAPIGKFVLDKDFDTILEKSIRNVPPNKATGVNEMFVVEAFKESPNEMSKFLCCLWEKCSNIGYLKKYWARAVLLPIYKNGRQDIQNGWRPIALVFHCRKTFRRRDWIKAKLGVCLQWLAAGISTYRSDGCSTWQLYCYGT